MFLDMISSLGSIVGDDPPVTCWIKFVVLELFATDKLISLLIPPTGRVFLIAPVSAVIQEDYPLT